MKAGKFRAIFKIKNCGIGL